MSTRIDEPDTRRARERNEWSDAPGERGAMRRLPAGGANTFRSRRSRPRWVAPVAALAAVALAGVGVWLSRAALVGMLALVISSAGGAQAIQAHAQVVPTPTPRVPLAPVPVGTFATRTYTDTHGASMTYYLYGPPSYTPYQNYPLILILHGGGEVSVSYKSAQQNRDILVDQEYVEAYTDTKIQEQYPAFVVAPQAPAGQRWVNVPATVRSYTLAAQPSISLNLADEIVQSLEKTYPMIDPNRIYVMGLSMGGFGAWETPERWPGTFAAAIPVSGAGDPHAAAAMAHVPVWALHGALDNVVPVQGSRLMIQAIKAAGGSPCYTELPQGAHNIWTEQNLDNPQLLSWLFSQTKAPGNGITPQSCPASAQG